LRAVQIIRLVCIIALLACPTLARGVEANCQARIKDILKRTPKAQFLCVDSQTVSSAQTLVKSEFEFDTVYAVNALDVPLSVRQIKHLFSHRKFILQIEGICAGKCARLLLPMATEVRFSKGAFAAMTDSAIISRADALATVLAGKQSLKADAGTGSNIKIGLDELMAAQRSYQDRLKTDYRTEVEMIAPTQTGITHLTWHAYVRQRLQNGTARYCPPVRSLAVVLTPAYMGHNGIRIKGVYRLPHRRDIVPRLIKSFGREVFIVYAYDERILSGCRQKG